MAQVYVTDPNGYNGRYVEYVVQTTLGPQDPNGKPVVIPQK